MQKLKKLISLNLALLFVLTVGIAPGKVRAGTQYAHYLIVDGVEYDATQEMSADKWSYHYDAAESFQRLYLHGYDGGAIRTNMIHPARLRQRAS